MIRSCIQPSILNGINLVYFSELTGKMAFIEKLAHELDTKIFILDFDTQFTVLKANNFLGPVFYHVDSPEIFLPNRLTPFDMVNKLLEVFETNSIIILDSLNGLLDYLEFSALYTGKNTLKSYNKDIASDYEVKFSKKNDTAYKALILLKILFQSPMRNKIPTIITSYISQRWCDDRIKILIDMDNIASINRNHFEKISTSIAFVKYEKVTKGLHYTTLFTQNFLSKLPSKEPRFPHSIKLT